MFLLKVVYSVMPPKDRARCTRPNAKSVGCKGSTSLAGGGLTGSQSMPAIELGNQGRSDGPDARRADEEIIQQSPVQGSREIWTSLSKLVPIASAEISSASMR
jgi:hypothetical protein